MAAENWTPEKFERAATHAEELAARLRSYATRMRAAGVEVVDWESVTFSNRIDDAIRRSFVPGRMLDALEDAARRAEEMHSAEKKKRKPKEP